MSDQRPATTLFAIEDEDEDGERAAPDVHFVNVLRWEGGAKVTAPRLFRAEELQDQEQLFALYGGGKYELNGRDATCSRIVARRALSLPGPSKPMHPAPEVASAPEVQQGNGETAQLLRALIAAQAPAGGGFNWQAVVALVGALAPVVGQYVQAGREQAASAQRQHQEFMTALLTQQSGQSEKFVQAMAGIYTANGSRAAESGGAARNDFIKGIEYATELIAGKAEGAAEAGEDFGIKDVIPLLTALAQQPSSAVAGAATAAAPAPAANGAAT